MAIGADHQLRQARVRRDPGRARQRLALPGLVLVATGLLLLAAALVLLVDARPLAPFSSRDPGSGSEQARAAIAHTTGVDPDFGVVALVQLPDGARAPASRARLARITAIMRADPGIARTVPATLRAQDPLTARNGRSALIVGQLRAGPIADRLDNARKLRTQLAGDRQVRLGGKAAFYANGNDLAAGDLLRTDAVAALLLIPLTLLVFRSVVAAGFVVLTAGSAVVLTLAALTLAGHLTEISVYARNVVTGLGLGLGLDYSLLLLTRVREEATLDGYGRPAVERALGRAGRTIAVSALIVAGAGLSLLAFPQPLLRSIGLAIVIVAGCACFTALVPLAALLVILGARINSGTLPRWRAGVGSTNRDSERGWWYTLARRVQARPSRYALVAGAIMLALAAPLTGVHLTQIDANVVPASSPDRQVTEAINRDFPLPGALAPVYAAIRAPGTPAAAQRVRAYAETLSRLPGVTRTAAPSRIAPRLWRVDVIPSGDPLGSRAEQIVRTVRAARAPFPTVVGGEAAQLVDLRGGLAARWPWALLILVVATLTPLGAATRSAWLPVKTLVLNALTLAAAFGVLVFFFQDGRLESLLRYSSSGALEAATMTVVAAIAFALATDYGVFLLTRIKEFRDHGLAQEEAIARGLQRTGPVISQAALLLCVALLSLVFARHALVKEVGVGTAVAVALDATLVRALLVPSVMALFGPAWNWWPGRDRR